MHTGPPEMMRGHCQFQIILCRLRRSDILGFVSYDGLKVKNLGSKCVKVKLVKKLKLKLTPIKGLCLTVS